MPADFKEGTPLEALWQCVMSAHQKWCAEVEARLGVNITARQSGVGHVFAPNLVPGATSAHAQRELDQIEDHIVDLYDSLRILQGDPITSRIRYREAADLYGRTPWDALVESGHTHIEAVLIGPDARAAEMLAAEPKLLAAARYRVQDSHDLDDFTPHVRQLLSRADSMRAATAIDELLKGKK